MVFFGAYYPVPQSRNKNPRSVYNLRAANVAGGASSSARKTLRSGKGKTLKSSTGFGGPEHIYRNPRVVPRAADIAPHSVTAPVTRSTIKELRQHKNFASTVGQLFDHAAAQCRAVVQDIINECESRQLPFFDSSFYFDQRDVLYPMGSPADCTVTEPRQCTRLSELFPSSPLICDGISCGDIVQGAVGDCFFIGAVSALASDSAKHLKPIERLFPAYSVKWGVYGVLFFKAGGWEWVIVDDFVPINPDRTPMFASAPGTEMWPMILEKAYAKVHFAWDTIDGGWGREALADLCGGLTKTFNLVGADKAMSFDQFRKLVEDDLTVVGCAVGDHVANQGGGGRAGEQGALYGLFKGHAYSVIKAEHTPDGVGFVRVRNPWGNDAEWKGPYSDNAKDWQLKPVHMKALNPEFKDDGAFWMKWDDFRQYFTEIDFMRYFENHWNVMTFFGSSLKDFYDPTNVFVLKVGGSQPVSAILSLEQQDPKVLADHTTRKKQGYATIRLAVRKLNGPPSKASDVSGYTDTSLDTIKDYSRGVNTTVTLEPGCYYALVPQIFDSAPGLGFFVRVFGPPESTFDFWRFSDPSEKLCCAPTVTQQPPLDQRRPSAEKPATPIPAPAVISDPRRPSNNSVIGNGAAAIVATDARRPSTAPSVASSQRSGGSNGSGGAWIGGTGVGVQPAPVSGYAGSWRPPSPAKPQQPTAPEEHEGGTQWFISMKNAPPQQSFGVNGVSVGPAARMLRSSQRTGSLGGGYTQPTAPLVAGGASLKSQNLAYGGISELVARPPETIEGQLLQHPNPPVMMKSVYNQICHSRDGLLDRRGVIDLSRELMTRGMFEILLEDAIRRQGNSRINFDEFQNVFHEIMTRYVKNLAAVAGVQNVGE